MITVTKIEGLAELRQKLLALPKELQKGPLRSAVSAGAKVIQDRAKEIVKSQSVETGLLLRSIYRTRSRSGSNAMQETHIVGVRSGRRRADKKKGIGAPYWWHVEFGTSKMEAEPFLRPALDTMKEKTVAVLKEKLLQAIDRTVAKLRR